MLRHKKNVHGSKSVVDRTESLDISDNETMGEEYIETSDSESEEEESMEKESIVWNSLLDETFEKMESKFQEEVDKFLEQNNTSEREAMTRVYENMKNVYRKTLMAALFEKVTWYLVMKNDPIYRAIKETAQTLRDEENYEDEESWKYAIHKRKFLLDKLLDDAGPPEPSHADDKNGSQSYYADNDSDRKI